MNLYIILYSNIQQLLDILRGIGEARSNELDLQPPQTEDRNEGEPESDRDSGEGSSDEGRQPASKRPKRQHRHQKSGASKSGSKRFHITCL